MTLFLGAAAGVGKTVAMLKAAAEKRKEGVDVLVGCLETELYPETERLREELNLPEWPKKGADMDFQGILRRHPQLVIVDRLEQVNSPAAMKPKRYLDVEAILSMGIDVYTSMNIQHVESLNDLVAQIVGWHVKETVPDTFLEQADRIQLIDLPTDEVIRRYHHRIHEEGEDEKKRKWFRPGNIDALREMAFRYAAQRLDSQLVQYMQAQKIAGPWPVAEKVMVCVSSSPFSRRLIRLGRQMAAGLKADWIAVYVDSSPWTAGRRQDELARNLQLAEELGAEVVSVTGTNIAEELLSIASSRNVKQIIIGKPNRSRISEWFGGSVVEKVIRNSRGISVHVIPGKPKSIPVKSAASRPLKPISWMPYMGITLLVALLTVLLHAFELAFDLVNIALIYLLPVLFSAMYGGIRPAVYAAVIGVLAFDFFFVPPVLSFTVADLRYLVSFAVYLAVAALTASLAARLKQQLIHAKLREAHTASLYALSRQMGAITDIRSVLENVSRQVSQTMGTEVVIYLPNDKKELELAIRSSPNSDWGRGQSERAVAGLVYEHGETAGKGTSTLRESPGFYVPLRTEDRVYGVLAVNLDGVNMVPSPENQRLLEALGGLAASAISRVQLAEEAKIAHLTAESERLRTALLDSVSHELRTPLATIIGSVTGLIDAEGLFTKEERMDLLSTIRDGALRMNRLVTNLLGMVQLESGMLRLRKAWCDAGEIVGAALSQMKEFQQHRMIKVSLPPELPLIPGDEALLEQVVANVISNAIKYSPDFSEIRISAEVADSRMVISVADQGVGLTPDDHERIFHKFYRSQATKHVPGTGLGLAICKGIAELHGGTITAEPNEGRGTIIRLALPLGEENNRGIPSQEGE
ncbi:sensor histidine kinase KdpD [Cohnella sp. CFH 77786]|uniref:sensor histidine kinase n=1 Tax=Cohnella sp. CFH 77786 TaxID=2662265 RepID=UPI001C60DAFC|nr:sensor histidine kinase KdpD [Cohnella sp. CFH 77786]